MLYITSNTLLLKLEWGDGLLQAYEGLPANGQISIIEPHLKGDNSD